MSTLTTPHNSISITSREAGLNRRRLAVWIARAETQLRNSDLLAARESAAIVLASDCHHMGGLEIMAKILWRMEDFVCLERTTNMLIALNPFEPGYHGLRGMALRALGRYGEAAKSLARDPNAADALRDLEGFQANLVRDIIAQDPLFAATYAADPERALTERGFHFEEKAAAHAWVSANVSTVSSFARRS
jgi:hypothetical protein